jgi:hypothetical protein
MIKEKKDTVDEFNIGISIYIIAEVLRRNESEKNAEKISLIDFINAL